MSDPDDLRARLHALPPNLEVRPGLGMDVQRTARRRRRMRQTVGSGVLVAAVAAGAFVVVPLLRDSPGDLPTAASQPASESGRTDDFSLDAGPAPLSAAASCPPGPSDVPSSEPSTSLERGTFVPAEPASSGLLCRYEPVAGSAGGAPSAGQRPLTPGELSQIAETWSVLPVAASSTCHPTAGRGDANFLVRLEYPDGGLWVAVYDPGGCAMATNGRLTTSADLGSVIRSAYDTRRWLMPTAGPNGVKRP